MSNNIIETDYIEKKKKTLINEPVIKRPNYLGFITNIITNMIQTILLFTISAGAIVNVNNPKYMTASGNFGNWPATDINNPPYGPGATAGGGATLDAATAATKQAFKRFFNLSKFDTPYNLPDMKKLLVKQKMLDEYNKKTEGMENPPPPPNVADVDPQAQLWPWALRMTAHSYSWMRAFFQEGLLSIIPNNQHEHSTIINSVIFLLGWAPLLLVGFLMYFIAPIMTIIGAAVSFKLWAWVGGGGLMSLFMMFFFPGLLYCAGLVAVPFFTSLLNQYIQPLYYFGFLLEPLFKNFHEVKKVMFAHGHLIALTGIAITVMSAISNSINAPGFIIGVVIMALISIAMGPGRKYIQKATS